LKNYSSDYHSIKKKSTFLFQKSLKKIYPHKNDIGGRIKTPKSVITLKENPQTCLPPPVCGQGTGR